MGYLITATTFLSMTMKLQNEWVTLSEAHELKQAASKNVVDEMVMYRRIS